MSQFSPGFDAGRANERVQLRENYSNMLVAHANSVNVGNVRSRAAIAGFRLSPVEMARRLPTADAGIPAC
jgi:Na+-transporting methylmalonyl-CoA/oxaloacetate decarboxylase beta subunit